MTDRNKIAVLAGGCFWGMEDLFREQPGVVSTRVGYTGGTNAHPTYRNHSGHAEALEITYDPDETNYRALLEFFFQIHDPTTKNRQGNDVGTSYRSAIFYLDDEQKQIALQTIADIEDSGRGPAQSSPRSTRPASFGKPNPSTRTTCNATHLATPATTSAANGRYPTAVKVRARGQRSQNMPSPLINDMGSVTQGKYPTTPPDWQVLLSAYAPLVLYGAVCPAGWVLRRTSNWRAAMTR